MRRGARFWGGRQHFRPKGAPDPEHAEQSGARLDGRDLTLEWQSRREGAVYIWNREQFEAVDLENTEHLLGLFEPKDMNWEADRAADSSMYDDENNALDSAGKKPRTFATEQDVLDSAILLDKGLRIDGEDGSVMLLYRDETASAGDDAGE